MNEYRVGQKVYRRGKLYGIVHAIEPASTSSRDPGGLIVRLTQTHYSGSDERDDMGIPAGTKFQTAFVSRVQIAGDDRMQVGTFAVQD